jgi:hypothetical protein
MRGGGSSQSVKLRGHVADISYELKLHLRRLIGIGCLAAMLAVGGPALAAGTPPPPGMPPAGHTRLGVASPKPGAFDRLTRHHHDVWLMFDMLGGHWVQYHGDRSDIDKATATHRIAMITLGVTRVSDRHRFSPAELAHGAADSIYLSYALQANGANVPVWIRPMQEMNGYWMSWCAFNQNGSRRGASYSQANFKGAFRRIAIIMRGGTRAEINAKLAAAGLHRLQAPVAADGVPPSGLVAMVWNPQGAGAPNSQNFRAYWKGMAPLYNYGKPFILGEWAPWSTDDPTFVSQVLNWVKTHPRTAALVYYQSSSRFDLSRKPKSLAAYRKLDQRAVFKTTA